jgi:hypothetical protein
VVAKRKAYVSGPMTGLADFNFPMFDSVTAVLRAQGVEVFSPADHDREVVAKLWPGKVPEDFPGYATGDLAGYFEAVRDGGRFTLENMLKADYNFIVNKATEFVCLPNWERSTGARWERSVAESLGIQIVRAEASAVDPADWLFVKDDEKRITEHLRSFGDPLREVIALVPPTLSPQVALGYLKGRLGHIPGMTARLEQIESVLA